MRRESLVVYIIGLVAISFVVFIVSIVLVAAEFIMEAPSAEKKLTALADADLKV